MILEDKPLTIIGSMLGLLIGLIALSLPSGLDFIHDFDYDVEEDKPDEYMAGLFGQFFVFLIVEIFAVLVGGILGFMADMIKDSF